MRRGEREGCEVETEGAILWELGGDWIVEPVQLDPPQYGEVQVRLGASGMCHSDEHQVTGDMPPLLPYLGGHEGAGVVEAVGPGVTAWPRATTSSSSSSPPAGGAGRAPRDTRTSATWGRSSPGGPRSTGRPGTTPGARSSRR